MVKKQEVKIQGGDKGHTMRERHDKQIQKETKSDHVRTPHIVRIEVKQGLVLGVGIQNMNAQPKDHTEYQFQLYTSGKKTHDEIMKVYSAGNFKIDAKEIEEAIRLINKPMEVKL